MCLSEINGNNKIYTIFLWEQLYVDSKMSVYQGWYHLCASDVSFGNLGMDLFAC